MEVEAFYRIQGYIDHISQYSTKFGVAWIFASIVFRVVPAIAFMDGIYADDQDVFLCVNTEPGCNQMCFNQFSLGYRELTSVGSRPESTNFSRKLHGANTVNIVEFLPEAKFLNDYTLDQSNVGFNKTLKS